MTSPDPAMYKTTIRHFDIDSPEDLVALEVIVDNISQNYGHWMDDIKSLNKEDIKHWVTEKENNRETPKLYAVIAVPISENDSTVQSIAPFQEIQAFIYAYPEEDKDTLNYIRVHKMLSGIEQNRTIFEISYAKHPQGMSGQIAKALPEVCFDLVSKMKITMNKSDGYPNLTIIGYSFSENIASIKLMEKCGFEIRGAVPEHKGAKTKVDLYVLNWAKFDEKFNAFNSITSLF